MFADDFEYNNLKLSDFGFIIGGIDNNGNVVSGGEVTITKVKTPNSDKYKFINLTYESVITWTINIVANPCEFPDMYLDEVIESGIAKWLMLRDNYHTLHFEQSGYENIYYEVMVTSLLPQQINGRTVGFTVIFESNCGYGWTEEITQKFKINKTSPYVFNVHNDIHTYIMPYTVIIGSGNYYISNDSDKYQNHIIDKSCQFTNIKDSIAMDSDNSIIQGISDSNDFNYYFLRLIDRENVISTDSNNDLNITIKYKEPRRVII